MSTQISNTYMSDLYSKILLKESVYRVKGVERCGNAFKDYAYSKVPKISLTGFFLNQNCTCDSYFCSVIIIFKNQHQ